MISKIIHQTWATKNIPYKVFKEEWINSWKINHPDWEYKLWTDEDIRDLIATHYPWFLKKYDTYDQGRKRSDTGRICLLHHYGGVYSDLDTFSVKNLSDLLKEDKYYLPVEPLHTPVHWSNCFIASNKGNKFAQFLIEKFNEMPANQDAVFVTGGGLIDRIMGSFDKKNEIFYLNDQVILWCNKNIDDIIKNIKAKSLNIAVEFESWNKKTIMAFTNECYAIHFSASYWY